jgi:excisionase family DNA binding protein
MHLSIKEAARFLNVSDHKVRGYIAAGRLSVERKGRQILIPQAQLRNLLDAEKGFEDPTPSASPEDHTSTPSINEALEAISNRLAGVEAQIAEKWQQLVAENDRLQELLREHARHIADKDLEIEKLRRDLVYQKRLCEKELEDRRQALEEKRALMAREASEKIARERELLEQRLIQEQQMWSERFAQEQERYAQKLAAMRDQEGFWARLMKMITWS